MLRLSELKAALRIREACGYGHNDSVSDRGDLTGDLRRNRRPEDYMRHDTEFSRANPIISFPDDYFTESATKKNLR
ncbi:MAG: hypothetical protein AABW79_03015 [Nanoarchaeota archaeon]|mgnify:CR=1 FL=1